MAPKGDATRPTTDRVKEAIFSILGDAILGARVADLCCGSGALGIEALSRGAAEVAFVDHTWQAVEAVKKNLSACGAEDGCYTVTCRDAQAWLESPAGDSERIDILMADPPYAGDVPAAIWSTGVKRAADGRVGLMILEHDPALELAAPPPGWRVDRRRYGGTALSIMERNDD